MKIEPATDNDINALCDLFNDAREANACFPRQRYSVDEFREAIAGEEILTARIGADLAGFAAVWVADTFLHHLYISPQYQNQGIGEMLLTACIERYGLPMTLKCNKGNTGARRFYERWEWLAVEEAEGPEGSYILYRYDKDT